MVLWLGCKGIKRYHCRERMKIAEELIRKQIADRVWHDIMKLNVREFVVAAEVEKKNIEKPLDKGGKEWYNSHIICKGYDEDEAVEVLTESRDGWKPTATETCLLSLPSRSPQSDASRVFRMAA